MNTKGIYLFTALLMLLASCAGSKYAYKTKGEDVDMAIKEETDVIDYHVLKDQEVPNLASRGAKGRGFIALPLVGQAISLAKTQVKKMIDEDQKKYIAQYKQGLGNLYFYDQLSVKSQFEPIGLQFRGFELLRMAEVKNDFIDTAVFLRFELDTTNPYEIINNAVFKLRLADLKIKYAKAKTDSRRWYMPWTLFQKKMDDRLNMDVIITFRSSWVNENGQLFDNVELGKFYLTLRGIPLNPEDPNYSVWYQQQIGRLLDGRSFIVPRSFGYHFTNGQYRPCYSQGAYSISVDVKESGTDKFITKMIQENSGQIVDLVGDELEKSIQKLDKK